MAHAHGLGMFPVIIDVYTSYQTLNPCAHHDAEFEMVDIEDYKVPLLGEPMPPMADEVIAWGAALKTLRAASV